MEDNKKDEKEYYIIYFDVLGYKQYFEENESHQQLLQEIKGMLSDTINDITGYGRLNRKSTNIKAFSDNVIICVESVANFNAQLLGTFVANIQAKIFANYGLLIRGAYTKGKIYIDGDIVYGEGLIKAVEMESKAKYPRIVSDLKLVCDRGLAKDRVFLEDSDDEIYLNYFGKSHLEKVAEQFREKLTQKIKNEGKYPSNIKDESKIKVYESIIQKTLWVVEKFNEACDAIGKPEEKIDYKVTINKRLLKMELSLAEKA